MGSLTREQFVDAMPPGLERLRDAAGRLFDDHLDVEGKRNVREALSLLRFGFAGSVPPIVSRRAERVGQNGFMSAEAAERRAILLQQPGSLYTKPLQVLGAPSVDGGGSALESSTVSVSATSPRTRQSDRLPDGFFPPGIITPARRAPSKPASADSLPSLARTTPAVRTLALSHASPYASPRKRGGLKTSRSLPEMPRRHLPGGKFSMAPREFDVDSSNSLSSKVSLSRRSILATNTATTLLRLPRY